MFSRFISLQPGYFITGFRFESIVSVSLAVIFLSSAGFLDESKKEVFSHADGEEQTILQKVAYSKAE